MSAGNPWGPGNPYYDFNAAGGALGQITRPGKGQLWVLDPETGAYNLMDYGRANHLGRDWMSDPAQFDAYMTALLTSPLYSDAPLGYGNTAWLADWAAQQGWTADIVPEGLNHWQAELWINLFDPWQENYELRTNGQITPVRATPLPGAMNPSHQVPLSPVSQDVLPWMQGLASSALGGSATQGGNPWDSPFMF